MTTAWREAASPQVQADFDALLDAALPFARQMLGEHGRFYPYGHVVTKAGKTEMIGAAGSRSGKRLVEMLLATLRQGREASRAAAVTAPVRHASADAVLVALEHAEGAAVDVFLPYRKQLLRRRFQFGEVVEEPGHRRIWAAS